MSQRPLIRSLLPGTLLGAQVSKTIGITVTAAALTVTVSVTPTKGYVGTGFTVMVNWSPVTVGPYKYDVDFGDGTAHATGTTQPSQAGITLSHVYSAVGTYTILARVNDTSTGATGSGTASVQAATALTVSFTADKTSGTPPLAVTFTVDPEGGYAPYSYTLDFGDGTTAATGTRAAAGPFTVAHTYSAAGSYTAKVTVGDSLGTSVMQTISIGAGVIILFPNLRKMFPRFFERVDKLRQRLPTRPTSEAQIV